MTHCDIAIVGGGLVGASLAIALAPSGRRVALIEAAPPPATAPAWDERCIALNVASRRIYERLGVWPALRGEAEPITATHISERGRFGVTRFTAAEAGEEALGWNIPVRALGAVLWRRLGGLPEFTLLCPGRVAGVANTDDAVTLALASGTGVTARLVVACDGARSAVRTALGIGAQERDYAQVAIVGAVRPERPHRGVAYERFLPGGPIALIPKPDGRCSVIWTVPAGDAPKMLAWSDAEFLAALQQGFGLRLGRFLETGRRDGHPLTRVMSDALTAPRVILAGNAAQALHPIAAQGFNLGLRDVATVSRSARHWGLLALDLLPPLKDAVMRQNLGFAGGTPSLARKAAARAQRPERPG
jgi:2-octaprenyl-6-methoxyphenol hydroxylase